MRSSYPRLAPLFLGAFRSDHCPLRGGLSRVSAALQRVSRPTLIFVIPEFPQSNSPNLTSPRNKPQARRRMYAFHLRKALATESVTLNGVHASIDCSVVAKERTEWFPKTTRLPRAPNSYPRRRIWQKRWRATASSSSSTICRSRWRFPSCGPAEVIMYANMGFERLIGEAVGAVLGKTWDILPGMAVGSADRNSLSDAIIAEEDYLGVFKIMGPPREYRWTRGPTSSSTKLDRPTYRLVALADIGNRSTTDQEKLEPANPGKGHPASRAAASREEQSPDDHRPHPARSAQPARQPREGAI